MSRHAHRLPVFTIELSSGGAPTGLGRLVGARTGFCPNEQAYANITGDAFALLDNALTLDSAELAF